MNNVSRCGYVAIIGRPNVGKSTLLNAILKQKISITSDKPQTTRFQILGIKKEGNIQAIFIDTPGMHDAMKNALNRYMNRLATAVIFDADVILWVVEALRWTDEDDVIFKKIQSSEKPVFIVLNKIDKCKDKSKLLPFIAKLQAKRPSASIVPVSASKRENLQVLESLIFKELPEGPHLFPSTEVTDKSIRFQAAECIREKLVRSTGQEVPYASTVTVDTLVEEDKLMRISAIIWVEREGQKAIVIGEGGERLKKIGMQARKDIESLVGKKVFLRLWVKVKNKWTDNEKSLQQLGY